MTQILKEFSDPTTILKNHTIGTHMFCLLLRTFLAIMIMNGTMQLLHIKILCVMVIVIFGIKYFRLPHVWKVYLRTMFTYGVVLILTCMYGNKYRVVSGSLIIGDVLLSIQSRHVFERISYLHNKINK
jgi:hypothetical protein